MADPVQPPGYIWWKNLKINPVFPKWGQTPYRLMRAAVEAAWESADPSTRLGAALHLEALSGALLTSCNVPVVPAPGGRLAENRRYKMAVTEHAETGVILTALTEFGRSGLGGTLYCPWACCADCARVIVAGACTMLVVHAPAMVWTPDDWRESIELGYQVLAEAGIPIYATTEPLNLPMRIRGQEITV